jgi:hypothetical protein
MPDVPLAVGTSTSPEKYQSKTSATPSSASATYPSRDMDMIAITLAMDSSSPRRWAHAAARPFVDRRTCFRRICLPEVIGAHVCMLANHGHDR